MESTESAESRKSVLVSENIRRTQLHCIIFITNTAPLSTLNIFFIRCALFWIQTILDPKEEALLPLLKGQSYENVCEIIALNYRLDPN
jgi:hypothetical protein